MGWLAAAKEPAEKKAGRNVTATTAVGDGSVLPALSVHSGDRNDGGRRIRGGYPVLRPSAAAVAGYQDKKSDSRQVWEG
jgi:hypothetical protein